MKKIALSFLILFLPCIIFAQTAQKVSLLVGNCKADESVCFTKQLFRYDFIDGKFTGKEEIISSDDLIFDTWRDKVYRDRYVITASGDVIDVVEKKVIHSDDGELHRIDGDKVYINNRQVNNGALYAFDLRTKKYERIRGLSRNMWFGKLSPNGIRSAQYSCPINIGCGLEISENNKPSYLLKFKMNIMAVGDLSSSSLMEAPIFWLDDERILTQQSNGQIIIVSIKKKIESVVNIKIDKYPRRSPRIYRNADNLIVYDCVNEYAIGVENKSYKQINGSVGNGFSMTDDAPLGTNFEAGKIFYFDKAEIGRVWATRPVTDKDYLAVHYGASGSNLGYPEGVKVWNKYKNDWTTLEIKWGAQIIGWIKE